jgi:hypothetical protein
MRRMCMADLKLPKLPARTPVKVTLSLPPDLNDALMEYSRAYEQAYGSSEPVSELIPAMLRAFIDGDRAFARRSGA